MDFFKSVGSTIFSILAIVCLLWGIANDATLVGFIGFGICIFFAIKLLNSVSSETWKVAHELEKQKQYNKLHHGYKCPNCGMNAGHEIGAFNKAASVSAFGLASDKIGKNYKCESCGYMW